MWSSNVTSLEKSYNYRKQTKLQVLMVLQNYDCQLQKIKKETNKLQVSVVLQSYKFQWSNKIESASDGGYWIRYGVQTHLKISSKFVLKLLPLFHGCLRRWWRNIKKCLGPFVTAATLSSTLWITYSFSLVKFYWTRPCCSSSLPRAR
jgi:hypothetical protein